MSISKESILHDIDAATAPGAMSQEEALEFLEDIASELEGRINGLKSDLEED